MAFAPVVRMQPQSLISMSTPSSDSLLVARAQAGDQRALSELVRRHRPAIERVCRRLCKDPSQVEDVIQETYLAILRHLGSFRGEAGFLTWVYTIARTYRGRASRSIARDRGRREVLARLGDSSPPHDPTPDDLVAGREMTHALELALTPLSAVDREIVIMRDIEGRSAAEIAIRVGLTVPAVKTRLHRARVFIRTQLDGLRTTAVAA
jgi:RNA polymerase sigma-70 factor (ECF subfamily)